MSRGPLLQAIWDKLPEERRQRIEEGAAREIEEYRTLLELREAAGISQGEMSERLGMAQSNLSRLEKYQDWKITTLEDYVEALGGNVHIMVELPDRAPVSFGVSEFLDGTSEEIHPA